MKSEGKLDYLKDTVSNSRIVKRAYRWKLREFKPKEEIYIESKRYIIKTVQDLDELEKVLNLRYRIFYEERINKKRFINIDYDKFDLICDHLIIIDKNIDQIVATYRLISSTFADSYYSETFFHMDSIKNAKGVKLELGRACVHADYRSGPVMVLLWKGLSEYMKKVTAKYLFGCSAIQTTNIVEVSLLYKYIHDLYLSSEDLRVVPKEKYRLNDLESFLQAYDKFDVSTERVETFIPPLLKGYFKAGSVICGEPAIDKNLGSADFFTVLDVDAISKSHEKKYKKYQVVNG
ncbi:MAG: GNAT family N-acyltransferase [Thermodesulfobacteriota bacterium]